MNALRRLRYWRRVAAAYLAPGQSQLSFWHESPEVNPELETDRLGPYYMTFRDKADYAGPRDHHGVPMLDYRGDISIQHNPIAVAQYGLANYNLLEGGEDKRRRRVVATADWLVRSLKKNRAGLWVWSHHFDWEYRDTLKAPWHSGLAQGQGVSLLVRAHLLDNHSGYLEAAHKAFVTMVTRIAEGGTLFVDREGHRWIEEYIVDPPTHILNGFMWASWGAYDLHLATGDAEALRLFDDSVVTLKANLPRYDLGFWSLYEQSGTRLGMIASPFYHRLHIVQLRIMARLTGDATFDSWADRWEGYAEKPWNRRRALLQKFLFKLLYY